MSGDKSTAYMPLTRAELRRHIRTRIRHLVQDDSSVAIDAFAIYSLADPRDVRNVRYVGQTREPTRRLLQHINTARLWLPDVLPWWVKSPELRPLYEWIRYLHRDGHRLPAMIITQWVGCAATARIAERQRIQECLQREMDILNVEKERLRGQRVLL